MLAVVVRLSTVYLIDGLVTRLVVVLGGIQGLVVTSCQFGVRLCRSCWRTTAGKYSVS